MASASITFEVLSLLAFFVVFSAWSFKYLFNHEIIRNYAHRTHYAKAQINNIIEHKAAKLHGLRLLRLDIDSGDTEEAPPVFSAQNSSQWAGNGGSEHIASSNPNTLGQGVFAAHKPDPSGILSTSAGPPLHHTRVHYVVGVLFSTVVTLSCELVLLLMIQLFGSVTLNLAILHLVITALVVLVTIVQPPLVISLYINQRIVPKLSFKSPSSVFRLAATLGLCVAWFLVLDRIGAIAQVLGPAAERSFLEEKTNELVLAGISITALLSGVGCMSTPIRTFWTDGVSSLKKPDIPREGADEARLNELIQSYNSTQMLKKKRQRGLDQLRASTGGTVYNAPEPDSLRSLKGSGRELLNRVQSFTSISSFTGSANEEDELQKEINSLQGLQDSIYNDFSKQLDAVLRGKENSTKTSTGLDRIVAFCELMFSVYCVYRIVNVLFLRLPYHYFYSSPDLHRETNIINDRDESETLNKNTKDALAITIAKLIQGVFGYLPVSETQLINQVSFILSSSLFVCSFQNVAVTFKSLGRFFPVAATSMNANVKTWIKHLIVSEFLAIYVIATALLIRSNMPPETAASISKILSLSPTSAPTSMAQMFSEVEFIDSWFDKVFGLSCVATFVVVAMKLFIESDNIYEGEYDEEMFIEDNSGLKRL